MRILVYVLVLIVTTFGSAALHAQAGDSKHQSDALQALNQVQPFIVGGTVVDSAARYPFMAAIYFDITGQQLFRPGCGGSLIADRWVLTAAHCLLNPDFGGPESPERIGVLLGTANLVRQEGTFINATRLILHPDYDRLTSQNDIALIELENPFPSALAVLPAVNSPIPSADDNGLVLGWGTIAEGGFPSVRLREVTLPMFNSAACYSRYRLGFDSSVGFCAGGTIEGGFDSCQGDSGGPLLVERDSSLVLAGLVSYGDGCARPGVPGVYTRVEAFTEWITSHTSGTLEYVGQQNSRDDSPVTRINVNTSIANEVAIRGADVYEITGATQVNLTSITGDADLYITSTSDFDAISSQSVLCVSESSDSLDICTVRNPNEVAFAVVHGFSNASYTLSTQAIVGDPQSVQVFDTDSEPVPETSGSGGGGGLGAAFLLFPLLLSFRVLKGVVARV